jgi:hypothetical protein
VIPSTSLPRRIGSLTLTRMFVREPRPSPLRPSAAVAVLLAVCGSGCFFTNMTLQPPVHKQVTTANGPVAQGRELLLLVPFTDRRPNMDRCGIKKNGYNMVTARIDCSAPPSEVLARLMAEELSAAGFKVVTDPAIATSAALRIEGELSQFFVEADMSPFTFIPEADIELRLLASSQSGLKAQRRFYEKAREVSVSGLDFNYQIVSVKVIKQMINRAVAAILELVGQYPQLGMPLQEEMAANTPIIQTGWQ